MAAPKFIQVHTLHSDPAALLNRDASGLAKRMTYGGATRTRVSSQCLKWHWRGKTVRNEDGRQYEDREFSLHKIAGAPEADRTRDAIAKRVIEPIRESGDVPPDVLSEVEKAFNIGVYGARGDNRDARQPLLLGRPEVEYLHDKAASICADNRDDPKAAVEATREFFNNHKENFKVMREQIGLPPGLHGGIEGALFGRMVTSDPAANIEAPIHVAHAFTVHAQEDENDFFTAVDDLQGENDPGASFMSSAELTAGLFYGYVVVDVPGLISNLEGCASADWLSADREMAAKVVEHLLYLIATVSPGAKLGSTAPYRFADLMLVEAGARQPRSLANAFRGRVDAQIDAATNALSSYLGKMDKAYGAREVRRFMSVEECEIPKAESVCMDDLAAWAADAVRNGEAV